MSKLIYLDNSATTQVDAEVAKIVQQELNCLSGNPSSWHSLGQIAKKKLSRSRESIAKYLGVDSSEIIFTSGGTEGLNMLIFGLASLTPSGEIITTTIEHPAVQKPLFHLEQQGWRIITPSINEYGAITADQLQGMINDNTKMIVLSASNHETGVKLDLEAISSVANTYKIPLIIDAVATLGKSSLRIHKGVTGMAFSGHKLHALPGTGFIYLRSGESMSPLLYGGSQENGLRGGTENLPGIVGLTKAISLLAESEQVILYKIQCLRDLFEKIILSNLSNVYINGLGPRVPNISNLYIKGIDAEDIVLQLDSHGVVASMGSACSSGNFEPSQVLIQMGYSQMRASQSIRFSFSRMNTEAEIIHAAKLLCQIVLSLLQKEQALINIDN